MLYAHVYKAYKSSQAPGQVGIILMEQEVGGYDSDDRLSQQKETIFFKCFCATRLDTTGKKTYSHNFNL